MKKKSTTFYCFSPPVMIITVIVELLSFLYVLYRYKLTPVTRLVGLALLLLATFQLAEFNVCGGTAADAFMRIGFVAITILPALGLHIIAKIANKRMWPLLLVSDTLSAGFVLLFGLRGSVFVEHICGGNYAIFTLANKAGGSFFAYYYALLFIGIGLSLYYAHSASKRVKRALMLQVVGYLSFLLPTGIVNMINPSTLDGIPSIMCGFAVLYAIILVVGVLPAVGKKR
jgi:hypothetical protein